jgi:hypothetical protein
VARSAAFWRDPAQALALPPVELLIVQRDGAPGVLPAAELAAASAATPLPLGQAATIAPGAPVTALFRGAELVPAARFRALGDHDWSD